MTSSTPTSAITQSDVSLKHRPPYGMCSHVHVLYSKAEPQPCVHTPSCHTIPLSPAQQNQQGILEEIKHETDSPPLYQNESFSLQPLDSPSLQPLDPISLQPLDSPSLDEVKSPLEIHKPQFLAQQQGEHLNYAWSVATGDTRSLTDGHSVLEFEDFGTKDFVQGNEGSIPEVKDLVAQEELFDAVRTFVRMATTRIVSSTSRLTPTGYSQLLSNTPVRITTDQGSLTNLERAYSPAAIQKAAEAHGIQLDLKNHHFMEKKLVQKDLCLKLSLMTHERIELAIEELATSYPYDESQFRAMFWERFIFLLQDGVKKQKQRVIRISEQRMQTVTLVKGEDTAHKGKPKKNRSKAHRIYPSGTRTYYPAIICNPAEHSISPQDMPAISLKLANAYIWFDLAYCVEADDILRLFTLELKRFARLPVNRLFWKWSPKGKHISKFHFLNFLTIEIKPLSISNDSDGLILKAVGYLVLNASACLHDYMKLLWLGASSSSTRFFAETPVIYLIAAVGFTARVFCFRIRKFDDSKPGTTGVRYEAVEMGNFDLTTEFGQTTFAILYNSIQSMALYYAALHKAAIINAMKSDRDIGLTELPELAFVQSKEDGKVFFQMINEQGTVLPEGIDEQTDISNSVLRGGSQSRVIFDASLYGELPKPDQDDMFDASLYGEPPNSDQDDMSVSVELL